MKAIRRLTILGLVAVLAAALPVLAQGPPGQMPPPPPGGHGGPPNPALGMAGRALHELDLASEFLLNKSVGAPKPREKQCEKTNAGPCSLA